MKQAKTRTVQLASNVYARIEGRGAMIYRQGTPDVLLAHADFCERPTKADLIEFVDSEIGMNTARGIMPPSEWEASLSDARPL